MMAPESTIDEDARKRLEAARRAGQADPIESFLPGQDDPRYLQTLEELICIDLEYAWKQARAADNSSSTAPPRLEMYLDRFPALRDPDRLRRLVEEEWYVRQRFGPTPTRDEFRDRFPQL